MLSVFRGSGLSCTLGDHVTMAHRFPPDNKTDGRTDRQKDRQTMACNLSEWPLCSSWLRVVDPRHDAVLVFS